ncbi:MAG: hypothetical protein R2849_23070 [Thermomicrobiales bacterium]
MGLEVVSGSPVDGRILLDWLDWSGAPEVTLAPPAAGTAWRAWVNGADRVEWNNPHPHQVIQNQGTGLLIQGTRDWRDYRATTILIPEMTARAGLAVVQGMRRYYALMLASGNRVQLLRSEASELFWPRPGWTGRSGSRSSFRWRRSGCGCVPASTAGKSSTSWTTTI